MRRPRDGGSFEKQGLEEITECLPDIVVSGISMARKDGHALIKEIRSSHLDLPALAIPAFSREEDKVRALKAGFNLHLPKPFNVPNLFALFTH